MAKTIISSGHNVALLRARNALIQQAGYAVVTSKEAAVVLEMVETHDFAAAVLCSSIPIHLRTTLARDLKVLKPDLPLIVIYADGEDDQLRPWANQLVQSSYGIAQPLIEAITAEAGDPDERAA
jgi:DNA-binding NtrC family response regulator